MSEDEYCPIKEAAVLAECGVRDLIHAGAIGRLPIYVIADGWQFSKVSEIYNKGTFTGIRVIYKDADEPNSPLFLPLDGLVPLYARCLSDQEDKAHSNDASVQVTLDLTDLRPAPFNENVIRYVKPDPAVTLSDAKMLIMTKDLKALQSDSISDVKSDQEELGKAKEKPLDKRTTHTLYLIIEALLHEAKMSDMAPYSAAHAINVILAKLGREQRNEKTIVTHLEEALAAQSASAKTPS